MFRAILVVSLLVIPLTVLWASRRSNWLAPVGAGEASTVDAASLVDAASTVDASTIDASMMTAEYPAEVDQDKVSDRFPDVMLTDQYGKSHRFRSELIKDKLCCITFFFTQCNGSCPGTIQKMVTIRQDLCKQFPAKEMQFLAITLDPESDSVPALLEYAKDRHIVQSPSLANWLFCTGEAEDLEAIRIALGMYELDPELDADRTNHAALIVFGNDATDSWTALPAGLKSADLIEAFQRFGRAK